MSRSTPHGSARPGRRAPAAALLLALLAAARPAAASNPDSTPVSPEAALTASAVLAADDPGGGGWYNPASLAAVTRSSVQVGASAYSVSTLSVDGAITTVLPWGTISGTMRSASYASVPSVISYAFKLREGLGLSLGVWTPFHDYTGGSVSGSSSGPYPGTGLTGRYSELYAFSRARDDTWGGAAIGWQASPRVRLGFMLQGSYSTRLGTLDVSAALRTDSTNPLEGGGHFALTERVDLSYLGLRGVGGLQVEVTPEVRLAVAVRSPGYRVVGWGAATQVVSAAALLPGVPPTEYQATVELPHGTDPAMIEPLRLYVGARWARGRWSLAAEADWHPALERWLSGQAAAWNGRVGGTCRLSEDLWAGAGLFRDTSEVSSGQTASAIDYYGFSGGLIYRPRKVVKALGGGDGWDMLGGVAVRGAMGRGTFTGVTFQPVDDAGVARQAATLRLVPNEAPARTLEGSLSLFTTIVF